MKLPNITNSDQSLLTKSNKANILRERERKKKKACEKLRAVLFKLDY